MLSPLKIAGITLDWTLRTYVMGILNITPDSFSGDGLLERAGYVIAGTPDDCLKSMEAIVPHLKMHRFDHLVIGVPLGPDLSEAVPLIAREILPALKKMVD